MGTLFRVANNLPVVMLLAASTLGHAAFPTVVEGFSCSTVQPTLLGDGSALVLLERGIASPSEFSLLKLSANGDRHSRFGENGIARLPGIAGPYELMALGDGRILAIGSTATRLHADGRIDTSYGINGSTARPILELAHPVGIAATPDGGLLVAGRGFVTTSASLVLSGTLADGRPTNAFGGRSSVTIPLTQLAEEPYAVSQLASGELEIASYRFVPCCEARVVRPVVRRISFPQSGEPVVAVLPGRVMPSHGVAAWTSPTVKVDALGRVVIGYAFNTIGDGGTLARFLPDGTPDASFGVNGAVTIPTFTEDERARRGSGLPQENLKAVWAAPGGGWTVLIDAVLPIGNFRFGTSEASKRLMRFTARGELEPAFQQRMQIPRLPVAVADDGSLLQAHGPWRTYWETRSCSVAPVRGTGPRVEGTLVEYYAPDLDHYFMTLEGLEVAILDAHPEMGWKRTGARFGAWALGDVPGAAPMCRFYGDLRGGPNSHFYIPEGSGCNGLRLLEANTPLGDPAWRLEGYVFSAREAFDASCPSTLAPVYRFYNDGVRHGKDPNHRYSIDPTVTPAMVAKGWVLEGIAFCVPPVSGRGEARQLF